MPTGPWPLVSGVGAQGGAYNSCMLHSLYSLVTPAAMERLTLLLNHVLASEPAASERLRSHAGRRIDLVLDGWPRLLPQAPVLAFLVTPAGLLEWCPEGASTEPDLRLRVAADNPALLAVRALAGVMPAVEVQGDSQLATDVNWLFEHLRWDIEADLARVLGPLAAHELARLGSALAGGLRTAMQELAPNGDAARERAAS